MKFELSSRRELFELTEFIKDNIVIYVVQLILFIAGLLAIWVSDYGIAAICLIFFVYCEVVLQTNRLRREIERIRR